MIDRGGQALATSSSASGGGSLGDRLTEGAPRLGVASGAVDVRRVASRVGDPSEAADGSGVAQRGEHQASSSIERAAVTAIGSTGPIG